MQRKVRSPHPTTWSSSTFQYVQGSTITCWYPELHPGQARIGHRAADWVKGIIRVIEKRKKNTSSIGKGSAAWHPPMWKICSIVGLADLGFACIHHLHLASLSVSTGNADRHAWAVTCQCSISASQDLIQIETPPSKQHSWLSMTSLCQRSFKLNLSLPWNWP